MRVVRQRAQQPLGVEAAGHRAGLTPSASGASVPCHSPWPQAGEDGQKKRSPGRMPVP